MEKVEQHSEDNMEDDSEDQEEEDSDYKKEEDSGGSTLKFRAGKTERVDYLRNQYSDSITQ